MDYIHGIDVRDCTRTGERYLKISAEYVVHGLNVSRSTKLWLFDRLRTCSGSKARFSAASTRASLHPGTRGARNGVYTLSAVFHGVGSSGSRR